MWREQATIEWPWHVNSIVACCHRAKLCALAARDFRSQKGYGFLCGLKMCRKRISPLPCCPPIYNSSNPHGLHGTMLQNETMEWLLNTCSKILSSQVVGCNMSRKRRRRVQSYNMKSCHISKKSLWIKDCIQYLQNRRWSYVILDSK